MPPATGRSGSGSNRMLLFVFDSDGDTDADDEGVATPCWQSPQPIGLGIGQFTFQRPS
jgi:hypothetical protein